MVLVNFDQQIDWSHCRLTGHGMVRNTVNMQEKVLKYYKYHVKQSSYINFIAMMLVLFKMNSTRMQGHYQYN